MYKGKVTPILMNNLLFLGLFGFAASFGLMGGQWAHLFLASLLVMVPVLLIITLVLAWANGFSFDDERHALVKPGGRNVPYAKVRAVLVTDRGATIDVFVKQGWLHTTALVECAGADRKAELLDELRKRFPDRVRMRGRMVSFVPVLVVLLALSAALAGMHLYLHQRFPALRASVQPLERLQEKARKKRPPLEYVEAFGFTPLRGLRYLGEEKGELYFEDKARKFRLKVMPGFQRTVFERQAVLFRYAMGVRDYEDLLALSYHSRFGVIPLYLRALDLAGLEQAAVYEIGPPVSGFIKQGRRDQVEETRIVMFGSRPGEEVHFFFTGPRRMTRDALRTFITGVELVQPGKQASTSSLFPGEGG